MINYDAREDTPILEPLPARPESVVGLAYAPDGRRVAIATGSGEITVHDAATGGELLPRWRHGFARLEGLRFTPDGTGLVARGPMSVQLLESESFHAPTTYFPLLVPECLLIEPTETESRQEIDAFVDAMIGIREEARTDPAKLKGAPYTLPVRHLDDVRAAKQLDLAWKAA